MVNIVIPSQQWIFTYEPPNCVDAQDGVLQVSCFPLSGTIVGTAVSSISCVCVDSQQAAATCTVDRCGKCRVHCFLWMLHYKHFETDRHLYGNKYLTHGFSSVFDQGPYLLSLCLITVKEPRRDKLNGLETLTLS